MVDYSGAHLKLARAKSHIEELDYLVFTYLRRHAYTVSMEADFQTAQSGFRIRLTEQPPIRLSAVIGDAVHNLYSGLDYIISANAIANGKSPKGTYFPTGQHREDFEANVADKARKAGDAAQRTCLDLRVYPGGNDGLLGLRELDLIDKHRLLVAIAAAGDFRFKMVPTLSGPRFDGEAPIYCMGSEDQFISIPAIFDGHTPSEIGLSLDVVFPLDGPFAGQPCVSVLNQLYEIVADIVRLFEQRCP